MAAWQNFYVIVGSSAGALIGLQFVVITLIAERGHRTSTETLNAFGTPTVVHFGGSLLISALISVPWPSDSAAAATLLALGFAGFLYGGVVVRRARHQTDYTPVWQDWVWYLTLPFAAYAALVWGAAFMFVGRTSALFFVAAAALGLLFIGIHNAWDTVTHIVMTGPESSGETIA